MRGKLWIGVASAALMALGFAPIASSQDRDPPGDASTQAQPIDTTLTIYNAEGQQVAFNDDTNGSLNSALDYVPSATGDVFVEAKSFNDTATGAYHLSVTATELPPDAVGNDASTRARIS